MLARIFSIRIMLTAIIGGAIIGGILSLAWHPLVYLWIPAALGIWLLAVMNTDNVLYCPHCRKRVKIGATTCHHCGRDVRPAA